MKKGEYVIAGIIAAILIIGLVTYVLMSKNEIITDDSVGDNDGINKTENSDLPVEEPAVDSGAMHQVDIKEFGYILQRTTIKVGDSVTWKNYDVAKHSITSDIGYELDSQLLGAGQTFTHKFEVAGTYKYHCTEHPGMKGQIVVI
jgi:plastocyanin